MSKPKQIIVVRTDLKMPTGKVAAQAAHASMAAVLNKATITTQDHNYTVNLTMDTSDPQQEAIAYWLETEFTKIVVAIDSEEALKELYETIKEAEPDMPMALIRDNGHTCFNGIQTLTCGAFGPTLPEKVDMYTRHLKLLK